MYAHSVFNCFNMRACVPLFPRSVHELCRRCWTEKSIPSEWHRSRVAALFKKGDEAQCGNYRPISLLCIGFKILGYILLARLVEAGSDERLWPSQFGFRRKRGTFDAIFVAKRMLERAQASSDEVLNFLALDWAKALDSIAPDSLLNALRRFGLPEEFVQMVAAIYEYRSFTVKDNGVTSETHRQSSGICQGCPLSPYLFVIVMTILMGDARALLVQHGFELPGDLPANDVLYADDTLLVERSEDTLQQYTNCVAEVGREYGLVFNWSKVELLRVRSMARVLNDTGVEAAPKDPLKYLGTTLTATGTQSGSELSRRLGLAMVDFKSLSRVWRHSRLTRARKIEIYTKCVEPALLYSLAAGWLNKSERRRLDAFQNRCLRKILRVLPVHLSRIPNETVRRRGECRRLSHVLFEQQLRYFGKVAFGLCGEVVRSTVFQPGTFDLQVIPNRARGRPANCWSYCVVREASRIAEAAGKPLVEFFTPPAVLTSWYKAVRQAWP